MTYTDRSQSPTEAQINANRENAKKSTGPRTAEGKAASSRNGLKHGLCADKHILPGEDPAEFLSLVQNLFDTFLPVGDGEEKLVLRIAAAQWRLDRIFPMEAGIYRDRFHDVARKEEFRQDQYQTKKGYAEDDGKPVPPPPAPPDQGDLLARAFNVDCEGPNSFTKLARYETSIERTIDRCLRQLKAFQAARNTPGTTPKGPAEASKPVSDPPEAPSKPVNCEANPNNGATAAPPPNPAQTHPRTQHPAPSTQNPAPSIQHPQSSTQRPAPAIQHPAPAIQHPQSSTQRPAPAIQHPAPAIQHPAPSTQHP